MTTLPIIWSEPHFQSRYLTAFFFCHRSIWAPAPRDTRLGAWRETLRELFGGLARARARARACLVGTEIGQNRHRDTRLGVGRAATSLVGNEHSASSPPMLESGNCSEPTGARPTVVPGPARYWHCSGSNRGYFCSRRQYFSHSWSAGALLCSRNLLPRANLSGTK